MGPVCRLQDSSLKRDFALWAPSHKETTMSDFLLDVGLAQKLKQAFGRNGWDLAEIDKLCEGDTLARVRAYLKNGVATLVQAATAVFTFAAGDKRSAKELLAAGKYDWVGDYARQFVEGKKFRLADKPEEVDMVLVEFGHDPTSDEVLAEFARQGLERPTEEDALRFGEKYPDEQKKYSIVFLHEPWQDPRGYRFVLVLRWDGRERELSHGWFGSRWYRDYRFAARRSRK